MVDSNKLDNLIENRKFITLSFYTLTILLISYIFIVGYFSHKQESNSVRKQLSLLAVQFEDLTANYFNKNISNFTVLSKLKAVREKDSIELNDLFKTFNEEFPEFINIAAVDEKGFFFASGRPFNSSNPPNVSKLEFFKKLENNEAKFVIMEPHIGPLSKQKVTGVVVRLEDFEQKYKGMLGTSIKLSHLTDKWGKFAKENNLKLISYKKNGDLFFSYGINDPDLTKLFSKLTTVQEDEAELEQFFHSKVFIPGLSVDAALLFGKAPSAFGGFFSSHLNLFIIALYFFVVSGLLFLHKKENLWIKILVQNEKELIAHRNQLEQLVKERTQELSITNQALQGSEERFRSLSDASFEGVIISQDGIIIDTNEQLNKMFDTPISESIGKPIIDFICPEEREKVKNKIINGQELPYETISIKKDGSTFPVEVQSKMFFYKGKQVRVAAIRDISERQLIVEELRASEERYRSMFHNNLSIMLIIDPATADIIDANPAALSFYGYNHDQITGMKISDINVMSEAEICAEMGRAKKALRKHFYFRHRLACGSIVDVEVFSGPVHIHDRELLYSIIHDITSRRQAEEALQKVHDELEQRVEDRTVELQKTHEQLLHVEKLSAIGSLSASFAHEFNNPLTGVTNVIRGIKKRAVFDEDDSELIDMAILECKRMKDLILSLQNFNRPTSGNVAIVDIHEIIDSLLLLSKKHFHLNQISVEKNYADNLPHIQAVADQIKQVILNLLNNSVDACEQGGTITINTEKENDNIIIRVNDSGIGIKPEDINHIFDPFFTTKPEVKGTGLGLSISYGIVKKHGGTIDVKSGPGKGSVFSVTLPISGVVYA